MGIMLIESKRIIDYKCLDMMSIIQDYLYTIDDDDDDDGLRSKINTWVNDNCKIIYPSKPSYILEYEFRRNTNKLMNKILNTEEKIYPNVAFHEIFELPISYDSSNDIEKYNSKKESFFNSMIKMFTYRNNEAGDDSVNEYKKTLSDGVNFGDISFEYINDFLSYVYNTYSENYIDGKIKCIYTTDENVTKYDYPNFNYNGNEGIYLSELEEYITSMGLDPIGLYEWILANEFVEVRYFEQIWEYGLLDTNYSGVEASDNIKQINEMLKQLYKRKSINIYIDYYKKVKIH